jgi:hypothetical protein
MHHRVVPPGKSADARSPTQAGWDVQGGAPLTLTEDSVRTLSVEERHTLEQLVHSRTAQARLVEQGRIVLAVADGRPK